MCFDEIGSPSALYDCTNPDWAPTQNMGHDNIAPESVGNAMSKYKRAKEREANKKQAASKKRKMSCSATSTTAAAFEVFSLQVPALWMLEEILALKVCTIMFI